MTAIVAFLLLTSSAPAPKESASTEYEPAGQVCLADLKAEVLANLWKRPPVPKPARNASFVWLSYHNQYGQPADAVVVALDGIPVKLMCGPFETSGEVFRGELAPGLHHFDIVFNFGPGRVGRASLAFRVSRGKEQALAVTIGRDSHEHPVASFPSVLRGVVR